MILKKLFVIFFCLLIYAFGYSQTKVVRDLEAWTGARIKKDIGNRWELSLEEEFRLEHNMSQLYEFLTEAGVSYSFNKQWRLRVNYRFIRNRTNSGDFETRYRLNADLSFRKDVNRLRISWRGRIQSRTEQNETYSTNNFRNRIAMKYNIRKSKFSPYFSAELYYGYSMIQDPRFNKMRFTFGSDYSLSGKSDINIFYRLEGELLEEYPKTTNIIGIKYDFGF